MKVRGEEVRIDRKDTAFVEMKDDVMDRAAITNDERSPRPLINLTKR